MGIFGDNLFGFDMNHDGKLDRTDDVLFMAAMDDYDRIHKQGIYEEDDIDSDLADDIEELEMAGLDYDDLEDMDEDERREAIEDAGLDPDDFDDDF